MWHESKGRDLHMRQMWLLLPQKSMLEAFKKRIESLGDQQWKCFFGRPDRAMNLENQEIEVYLIGNFHEDIKTESFLESAKNTS